MLEKSKFMGLQFINSAPQSPPVGQFFSFVLFLWGGVSTGGWGWGEGEGGEGERGGGYRSWWHDTGLPWAPLSDSQNNLYRLH
jgi:hypothetical protein